MILKLKKDEYIYLFVSIISLLISVVDIIPGYKAYMYISILLVTWNFGMSLKYRSFSLYQVFLFILYMWSAFSFYYLTDFIFSPRDSVLKSITDIIFALAVCFVITGFDKITLKSRYKHGQGITDGVVYESVSACDA